MGVHDSIPQQVDDECMLSLEDALAEAETGAHLVSGGYISTVFLPNRFNGRCYWLTCGIGGQPPDKKHKHHQLGGILAIARLQGLDVTTGWQPI